MALSLVVMRLARNPGTEFADGDDHRGYALTAPLTSDGKLDEAEYRKHRSACTVRRFASDEDPQEGRLARRGERWFFDYGDQSDTDEPLYSRGRPPFRRRRNMSKYHRRGRSRLLTYKVTEARAAKLGLDEISRRAPMPSQNFSIRGTFGALEEGLDRLGVSPGHSQDGVFVPDSTTCHHLLPVRMRGQKASSAASVGA